MLSPSFNPGASPDLLALFSPYSSLLKTLSSTCHSLSSNLFKASSVVFELKSSSCFICSNSSSILPRVSPPVFKDSFANSILFNNSFSPGNPEVPGLVPVSPFLRSPDFPFSLPPGFFEGLGVPFFPSLPLPEVALVVPRLNNHTLLFFLISTPDRALLWHPLLCQLRMFLFA